MPWVCSLFLDFGAQLGDLHSSAGFSLPTVGALCASCSGTRELHLQGGIQDVVVNVTVGIQGSPQLQLVLARTVMTFAVSGQFGHCHCS